jgi:hypothetical protein
MKFLKPSYRTPATGDKSGQRHLPVTGYPVSRNPGHSGEVLALSEHLFEDEAREFALAFRGFLDWVHATAPRERNEVSALVRDFLGPDGTRHSVVGRRLPAFEHVNLQTAIDAWSVRPGRTAAIQGIAMPPHHGDLSLQQLVAGEGLPSLRLTAPALADLPNGPGSTLGCLRLALLLVTDGDGRYVVMIQGPRPGVEPGAV